MGCGIFSLDVSREQRQSGPASVVMISAQAATGPFVW